MSKRINYKILLGAAFLLVISLAMAGCSNAFAPNATANNSPSSNSNNANALVDNTGTGSASTDATNEPTNLNPQQRIVLKNASLTLTVQDPAQTVTQITQLVEGAGGWVVNSNTTGAEYNGSKVIQGTISVRVPADKFVTLLDQIKASAASVDSETITGEDVTQKYVDLNSQLTNLQNTEAQLQKIMSTANSVTDVLSVQNQLTTVHGQIEQIKGQLQYYSQAAAYSLISLTLNQQATTAPNILGIANWHPDQTIRDAFSALITLVQAFITLLIWLIMIGLPFAVIVLIAYRIWLRLRPSLVARVKIAAPPKT